eukprot:COSAG03_NODE_17159_length_382_cov_1.268551_1_plen_39_part_10
MTEQVVAENVVRWGAVWQQARSFCPTLPLSSDVSQWLPM